eukprot:TRINITY_DN7003_c0_g1_i3.p1 TRINITY_DN7003_c0_g1~~TRINITY_DN7003_c0_g1_i3.p1  ORF type:complete len:744 (+),score=100.04 TRINITY_DN7003_c0_g1_i3:194-2425(+)
MATEKTLRCPSHSQSAKPRVNTRRNSDTSFDFFHRDQEYAFKWAKNCCNTKNKTGSIAIQPSSIRELNLHFQLSKPSSGPVLCQWAIFNRIPTEVLSMVYLIFLGGVVGFLGVSIDVLIWYFTLGHTHFMNLSPWIAGKFVLWCLYIVVFLVAAVMITQNVGPNAKGSGIPEMKCIIGGVWLKRYLGMDVFLAKVMGLTLAIGSGAFIGKEGPMVHLSSILEDQLTKRFGVFGKLRRNPAMMQQLLAAACAIGVAANYGAPFGGLLFSIEVTSTYYPIRNYYYSFVCSLSGSLAFLILWNTFLGQPIGTPFLPSEQRCNVTLEHFADFFTSAIIGLCGGVMGFIVIRGYSAIMWLRRTYSEFPLFFPYPYTMAIAFLTGIFTFPFLVGDIISMPSKTMMVNMFDPEFQFSQVSDSVFGYTLQMPREAHYGILIVVHLVLQILTMSLPVPLGIMSPTLALGTVMGYLIATILSNVPAFHLVNVHAMAMVGAASMATGVTQTLSTAILIVEMTGEFQVIILAMFGVVISMAVSSSLGQDIFEVILQLRRLPYLPSLNVSSSVIKARDIMDTSYPIINVATVHVPELMNLKKLKLTASDNDLLSHQQYAIVDQNEHFFGSIPEAAVEMALTRIKNKEISHDQLRSCLEEYSREYNEFVVPFTFSPETTLEQVHSSFVTLRLPIAFVTTQGKVLGTITRQKVMDLAYLGDAAQIVKHFVQKRQTQMEETEEDNTDLIDSNEGLGIIN